MKYFIDTEFIEGFHKPLFGKKRHFIDLISIGIVSEDGREYYAVSNEYNSNDADDWVKQNVLFKIHSEYIPRDVRVGLHTNSIVKWKVPNAKSNKQIAQEVFNFCTNDTLTIEKAKQYNVTYDNIEFYGYYSDYDWVLFCSLFGRMIDLPKGFPMYCKDLKQMIDEENKYSMDVYNRSFKDYVGFPKQENEHNALDDAKWNKQLYDFIKKFSYPAPV